jgi:hypothetical protein
MDKVLIIGLLTIAGVTTALILFFGLQTSIEETSEQNKEKQVQAGLIAQTIIDIVNVRTGDNGTSLDVWIKNRGIVEVGLHMKENFELFLVDIEGNWGDYIDYSPAGPVIGEDTWSLVGPTNQTWRPGGTLHVSVSLLDNPVLAGGYDISINTPGNVTARYRFYGDPNSIRPPTATPAP